MSEEQQVTATICTCLNGPRCPEGNALWEVALDAWEVALNDYRDHVYQAAKAVADTADQRRRARAARRAVSDDELPGMWSHADLSGGWAYTQDGNPTPGEPTMDLTEGRLRPDLPAGDSGSTAITSTWTDLYDRLDHAATTLAELSRDENRTESDRDHLRSKAQGVRLALSYMQDMGGSENGREDDPREAVAPGDERYYRPQKNGSYEGRSK